MEALRSQLTRYHLTVVATLQWVWTFLTGIYGMNFVDEDGHPTVPLLGRSASAGRGTSVQIEY